MERNNEKEKVINNKIQLRRSDILFPELSYKIVGCAFDVYVGLGSGHAEKFYQKALAETFKNKKLLFKEQVYTPLKYCGNIIGKQYLDFLIENEIIVEIKKNNRYSKANIDQVLEYLKINNKRLAILINFGNEGVTFKRIINFL